MNSTHRLQACHVLLRDNYTRSAATSKGMDATSAACEKIIRHVCLRLFHDIDITDIAQPSLCPTVCEN